MGSESSHAAGRLFSCVDSGSVPIHPSIHMAPINLAQRTGIFSNTPGPFIVLNLLKFFC